MKKILLSVLLVFLFMTTTQAKAERTSICEPRIPVIDYSEAIAIAKKASISIIPNNESFVDY